MQLRNIDQSSAYSSQQTYCPCQPGGPAPSGNSYAAGFNAGYNDAIRISADANSGCCPGFNPSLMQGLAANFGAGQTSPMAALLQELMMELMMILGGQEYGQSAYGDNGMNYGGNDYGNGNSYQGNCNSGGNYGNYANSGGHGNYGGNHNYSDNNDVGSVANTDNVRISGDGQGVDAVNWALSQTGVNERDNPGTVRSYCQGRNESWCANFASTAFEKTGGSPWGHQPSVQGILNWGRNHSGHFMSANEARQDPSKLKVGDVVVWKQNGASHVGLLKSIGKNGTFTTIEGNTSDRVASRTHNFRDSKLTGFVRGRGTY